MYGLWSSRIDESKKTMIAPSPYKLICTKCGFTKIVKPKSDVFNTIEEFPFCPKCKSNMEVKELNKFDIIFDILKTPFNK